jgi:hypothetical protein
MMTFHLRTFISLLITVFVLGFFSTFLFTGCDRNKISKKDISVTPKVLKKQADTIQENYLKQIASLQDQNLELQQDLEITQGLLEQAKLVTKQKEIKIKKIIEPKGYPAKELLQKIEITPSINNDLSPCDSLITEVHEYIEENHRKDSLYEVQLIQMDSVVTVKDDLIQANEKAYTNLNLLFGQSLTAQGNLIKENKLLQRQFKRQRFKNKLITTGLMILSATAANYLLHH